MRHDRGTEDTDGKVERVLAADGLQRRHDACDHRMPVRFHEHQFNKQARGNGQYQAKDDGFHLAKTIAFQAQHNQRVEGCQQHPHGQGHAQQQFERQRAPQHFGQVAGNDGNFCKHPQHLADGGTVLFAAVHRQILPRHHAKPHAQALQHNGGKARQDHHEQQLVAVLRAGLDGGGPVTRIHVPHRDQQPRTGKA